MSMRAHLRVRETTGPGNGARAGQSSRNGSMQPLMLFRLGRLCATNGAIRTLTSAAADPIEYVARHLAGNWGDVDPVDAAANDRALQGYRKGGAMPNGAVIVFDLLDVDTGVNAIQEGARKVVGVMAKDNAKWRETGGWGFEGFKGDSKTERAVGAQAASACFGCHAPQKATDYVFSRWRK